MKLYRENEETPSDDKNKRVMFDNNITVTFLTDEEAEKAVAAFENIKNYGAYFSRKRNKDEIEAAVKKHFGPPGFERKTLEKERGKPFPIKTKPTLDGFILMLNVLTKIFIDTPKTPDEITKTTGQIIKDAGDIITNNPEEAARIFNEKYNSALKLNTDKKSGMAIIDYNELIKYLENTLGSEYLSSLDKPLTLKYEKKGKSITFPPSGHFTKKETKRIIKTILEKAGIKNSLEKENIKEIIRQYVKEAIQRA